MLIFETVINRYLALDPEMLGKLQAFDGKVIKIEVTVINKTLYMLPDETGIQILTEFEGEADTTLRGSPLSLFKLGLVSNTANLLLKGEVEIMGDTRLGHQFKNVFNQMEIDWSEPLAEIVGDGLAFQLQQTGRKWTTWSQDTVSSLSNSVSEYLQEESRDVVTETELNIFNDAVDQLRNDVDRLQQKIQSLPTK
ncbi:Protein YigP (COG3165) clustered with ubiquinone biosynthetic genes [hydrothermal vent metagenome]|uniref:Protein YigP (COG3165) clustered with ubiquinone biosynthetic genes n=1 Tax=hydrothermal vent metagenome TaxID=652676 RepID=A0A3B0WMW2_9ZZZZ